MYVPSPTTHAQLHYHAVLLILVCWPSLSHPFAPCPFTGNTTATTSVLDAPPACPSYSCVCSGKPDGSLVPAPQDCRVFVACTSGTGTARMCAGGFGFDPKASTCKPLSAASTGTNGTMACVFADDDPFSLEPKAGEWRWHQGGSLSVSGSCGHMYLVY